MGFAKLESFLQDLAKFLLLVRIIAAINVAAVINIVNLNIGISKFRGQAGVLHENAVQIFFQIRLSGF